MYLADINFIEGPFDDPTYILGRLIVILSHRVQNTGTYTGNSFYLKFDDNSNNTSTTLGKDSSGLGNNWIQQIYIQHMMQLKIIHK